MKTKNNETTLYLDFSKDYQKAVFGTLHVAFMTRDEKYVLSNEDYDSLKMSIWFYENKIKNLKKYPVFDSQSYSFKEGTDRQVLFQVLGLPHCVFDNLDFNADILSQLTFSDELVTLRKECYHQRANEINQKWYHDDFKLYCLKKGIYFLYDETIPFISDENPVVPIFFDEDKFDLDFRKEYDTFDYERLAIDFVGVEYDKNFIEIMKALDQFPLQKRIDYFINDIYSSDIAGIVFDPAYRKKYAKILRRLIASFINYIYDCYSYSVIHTPTVKNSYLTKVLIRNERNYHSISSFSGDMFSFDCENWFFSVFQKEEIRKTIQKLYDEYGSDDLLGIYSRSALPYYGYLQLKDKKITSALEFMSNLSFSEELSFTEYFLGVKRYDANYSYFFSSLEHRLVFLSRYLISQGILVFPLKNIERTDLRLNIKILSQNRDLPFAKLVDEDEYSLKDNFYPSLLVYERKLQDKKLEAMLKELDKRSSLHAGYEFFHSFDNRTVQDAVERLLSRYDMMAYLDIALPFFSYLVLYPFYTAISQFRKECLKEGCDDILRIYDNFWQGKLSYEPDLKFPYVEKGKLFYAFKETPFSKPYLCRCSKKALEERYTYLLNVYEKEKDSVAENDPGFENPSDIIYELGLPEEVEQYLKGCGDNFMSKIPYKKGICHICQEYQPVDYDCFDNYPHKFYNVYSNYLKQKCYENGYHIDPNFNVKGTFSSFLNQLKNNSYHSLFSIDRTKPMDPILKPYLNMDETALLSLLACFYPSEIEQDDMMRALYDFMQLGMDTIKRLLFDCTPSKITFIISNIYIFGHLLYIYENLNMAYVTRLSKKIHDDHFEDYCFNYDYNPHLVYPYIFFGTRFNAYTDDLEGGHYYFCECDKETIRNVMSFVLNNFQGRNSDPEWMPSVKPEWLAPMVLGVTGLPYPVVLKFKDVDFDTITVDDIINRMEFRQSICRRCLNVSHSSYMSAFVKAEPFKSENIAELRFANEALAKDGLLCLDMDSLIDKGLDSKEKINPMDADESMPFLVPMSKQFPESVYRIFNPSKEEIQDDLYALSCKFNITQETLAYATGVILDTYKSNPNVMFQLSVERLYDDNLFAKIDKLFPQIARLRKEFIKPVKTVILSYLSYLYQKLISYYVDKEKHIGR